MGILDKIKEGYETIKNASNKSVTDYEKEGGAKPPKKPKPAPVVPEDDMPATDAKGKYLKPTVTTTMAKGGLAKGKPAKGKSASSRGDGIAQRGKTKGRMV